MRPSREPRSSRPRYSAEDLQKALTSIAAGMAISVASRTFNIPTSTLYDNRKSREPPEPTLAEELDEELVDWVITMSDKGFPIMKGQVINSVQELLKKMDKAKLGTDCLEEAWWQGFKTRYPEIFHRIMDNMRHTRETVTEESIRQWFDRHRARLTSTNLLNIEASRKFCCDECGFLYYPQGEKALVKRNEHYAYNFTNKHAKECLTVLFCGNALGEMLPIMVIVNYLRLPTNIISAIPVNYSMKCSESGWTTPRVFLDWLRRSFLPCVIRNGIQLPVVLYLDRHAPYLSLAVSKFCHANGIELAGLYPHSSHVLPPLDVGVLKPLEEVWRKVATEWTVAHNGERLNKENVEGVFQTALDQLDSRSTLCNGFHQAGLHSLPTDVINVEAQAQTSSQESLATPGTSVGPWSMPLVEFGEAHIDKTLHTDVIYDEAHAQTSYHEPLWAPGATEGLPFLEFGQVQSSSQESLVTPGTSVGLLPMPLEFGEAHIDKKLHTDVIYAEAQAQISSQESLATPGTSVGLLPMPPVEFGEAHIDKTLHTDVIYDEAQAQTSYHGSLWIPGATEGMSFVERVEAYIDKELLQTFKMVDEMSEWPGDISHESLFSFWRRVTNSERRDGNTAGTS